MTGHNDTSAESEYALLPCPLCGGKAHFYENEVDFVPKWSVGCDECPANFDACEDTKAEVSTFWNNRPRAPAAKVISLEWEERTDGKWGDVSYWADHQFGCYAVERDYFSVKSWELVAGGRVIGNFDSVEVAQIAAQENFEERVRSCLIPNSYDPTTQPYDEPFKHVSSDGDMRRAAVALTCAPAQAVSEPFGWVALYGGQKLFLTVKGAADHYARCCEVVPVYAAQPPAAPVETDLDDLREENKRLHKRIETVITERLNVEYAFAMDAKRQIEKENAALKEQLQRSSAGSGKAMHDAFMAMCSHRDSPDDEAFQDAIDALGMACNAEPQPSAGTAKRTKLVYVKRWRTLVELPEKYADEIVQALRAEPQEVPDPLRHAFRAADDIDWKHLDQFIPHSGHGQFWRAVFAEVRGALAHSRPHHSGGEA